MADKIYHPSHYTFGDIEVIDYIKDKLSTEQYVGYCIGNVIKYVSRWKHKGGIDDLRKAQVYLGWAINSQETEEESTAEHINIIDEKLFGYCDECHISGFLYKRADGKKVCAKCWNEEGTSHK